MAMTRSFVKRLDAFRRDSAGNATIEFVVLFPFLIYMLFSIAEAGVLMTRTVMLDRGLDIAIRDLRLGLTPGVTHDDIKTQISIALLIIAGRPPQSQPHSQQTAEATQCLQPWLRFF